MQGTQNQFGFLPDQHSDFPFAVFAEDWGFLGCVVVLGLYCFLCIWAVNIASQASSTESEMAGRQPVCLPDGPGHILGGATRAG